MDINVSRTWQSFELMIKDGGTAISSGLLSDSEAIEVAARLISVAEKLLPFDSDLLKRKIDDIRDEIDTHKGDT